MELKPIHFKHFFSAVHGSSPFPWQQALVDRLAEKDEWPDVLDLPTGTGKTAALDVAVFHLALRATTPGKAAIRIVLVVDRKLVVDDAYIRAKKIEKALASNANSAGETEEERLTISEVAERLGHLAEKRERPLVVQRLRGGIPLENEWVRTPTQPTILCSTVDQVGSRLLFRGYGVSDRMKPIHAGLLGQDSLIFLDEAHLSQPFRQTLSSLQKVGRVGVQTVLLSATLGSKPVTSHKLTAADLRHPILKQRLEAPKPTKLYERPCEGIEEFVRVSADISSDMAERLRRADVPAPAVGVIVNRVFLAREIFDKLKEQHPEYDLLLMIGRSRNVDRAQIIKRLKPLRTCSARRSGTTPLFVVATQCLEVGVDIDLDGLVTQAAPLDALLQRLGRLNRAGRNPHAEGAILTLAEDVAPKVDDPIYGDRIQTTWEALKEFGEDSVVNFGIDQIANWQESRDFSDLVAPRTDAPILMPAYLDLWSQTSPIPNADPDVNLFLHGVPNTSADVSLVWRSDLKEQDIKKNDEKLRESLEELMSLVPPKSGETLAIPLWAARKWLTNDSTDVENVADVPGKDSTGSVRFGSRRRLAFRWAGRNNSRTEVIGGSDLISPGDVLVVPAEYGGCDSFGWAPKYDHPVLDVAEQAAMPDNVAEQTVLPKGYAVRVARDGVRTDRQWRRLAAILAEDSATENHRVDRLIDVFKSVEREAMGHGNQEQERSMRNISTGLKKIQKHALASAITIYPYAKCLTSAGGAIFVVEKGPTGIFESCGASTEDDLLSHSARDAVLLDDHSQDVEDWTKNFCGKLKLCPDLIEDITLAAFLHDAGKADPRFQDMLCGGHAWNQSDNFVLAKSGQPRVRYAWKQSKLPQGWRHESLSVRVAEAHPRFAKARDPSLVLWLIGTHHGFGRPFFSFADDQTSRSLRPCLGIETESISFGLGPESLAFDYDGDDWPRLFEKLKENYGRWRLALFEAILRLADHRASEEGGGVR